jgi:AcrR family transcriptional regulator
MAHRDEGGARSRSTTPRIQLPVRERGRRTQAERTAETRARILAAVTECIADVGFPRTTASEVTRRAGVTWGAVQHHFGGKDGMFVAVLEDAFNRFAERLAEVPAEGTSLEKRAALFVERAWDHFRSTEYRSTFEILLHYLRREDLPAETRWPVEMARAWDRVWLQWFDDAKISRGRQRMLQHYTISVLSGLTSTLMLQGDQARLRSAELDLIVQTLTRELSRES